MSLLSFYLLSIYFVLFSLGHSDFQFLFSHVHNMVACLIYHILLYKSCPVIYCSEIETLKKEKESDRVELEKRLDDAAKMLTTVLRPTAVEEEDGSSRGAEKRSSNNNNNIKKRP